MLDRTEKSTMILTRGQSTRMTRDSAGNEARHSAPTNPPKQMTAFDDEELSSWLMECIVEGSENFLCAIAEAAVAGNAEDYLILRPALLALMRKHNSKRAM